MKEVFAFDELGLVIVWCFGFSEKVKLCCISQEKSKDYKKTDFSAEQHVAFKAPTTKL